MNIMNFPEIVRGTWDADRRRFVQQVDCAECGSTVLASDPNCSKCNWANPYSKFDDKARESFEGLSEDGRTKLALELEEQSEAEHLAENQSIEVAKATGNWDEIGS